MPDYVRLFACASVIALGGFSATSAMLACSSDPATTPAGDDDDDDDDTTGKKDGGSTSSSSSSSSGSADAGPCNPVGSYTINKPTFTVSDPGPTGGSVCQAYVNGGTAQGEAAEVTITKLPSGDYHAVSITKASMNKSELDMALKPEICQLGGGIGSEGVPATDGDGKDIIAKFTGTQFYELNGGTIVARANTKIESDPAGAKGTDCFVTQASTGTKK